jgi:hypothetical protein
MEVIKTPKVGSFDSWNCRTKKTVQKTCHFHFTLSKAFLCPAVFLLWKTHWAKRIEWHASEMLTDSVCWFIIKCEVSDRLPATSHFLKKGNHPGLVSGWVTWVSDSEPQPRSQMRIHLPRLARIINANQVYFFAVNGRNKNQLLVCVCCLLYNSRDQRKDNWSLYIIPLRTRHYMAVKTWIMHDSGTHTHRLDEEKRRSVGGPAERVGADISAGVPVSARAR